MATRVGKKLILEVPETRSIGTQTAVVPTTGGNTIVNVKNTKMGKKRKRKTFKESYRMGDYHSHILQDAAYDMNPSTGRYGRLVLTAVDVGDTLDLRKTNLQFNDRFIFRQTLRNQSANPRFIKYFMLQLRGSEDAASATFADLLIDSGYATSGPTGLADDLLLRINQDIYKLLWKKTLRIGGAGADDMPSSKLVKFSIPVRKYVSYKYNSTETRSGALYFGWIVTERDGQAISSVVVNGGYYAQMHRYDVIRTLPKGLGGL